MSDGAIAMCTILGGLVGLALSVMVIFAYHVGWTNGFREGTRK